MPGLLDTFKKKKSHWLRSAQGGKAVHKHSDDESHAHDDVAPAEASHKAVAHQLQGIGYRVLAHPHVSERAAVAESRGVYTFVVHKGATKTEITRAITEVYGVTPVAIRTMNIEGHAHQVGRMRGRRSDWKKAMVTLPAGKTIHIHEGV